MEQNPIDEYLKQVIEREINRYARRPLLSAGKKYRRTIHDKLFEEKHFNVEYFRDQLILIYERKSRLPKAEREFILYVGNRAMAKMALAKKVKAGKKVEKVKAEAKKLSDFDTLDCPCCERPTKPQRINKNNSVAYKCNGCGEQFTILADGSLKE